MSASGLEAESDSEGDWEEVEVPQQEKHLEITISTRPPQEKNNRISPAERRLRVHCHKLHTLALLTNAWVRNKWINDPLLQARLLSLTPLSLQTAFAMIHKSRVPDQHMRGRMFETAMGHLTFWWAQTFFDVTFDGHLRNRTFDAVRASLEARDIAADESLDVELLQKVLEDEGELIRSSKSLMKHALMQKGSRDTSAQLFTALCRALGIPARLVVSLQSVPWKSPKPVQGKKTEEEVVYDKKGKGKAKAESSAFKGNGQRLDGSSIPQKSEKAKGKEKAKPPIKLRKAKSKGNVLGSGPTSTSRRDPVTTPPVFWTEVFSRPDGRWLPVDPIRGFVNQPHTFDPTFESAAAATSIAAANPDSAYYARRSAGPARARLFKPVKHTPDDNRMVYVLAFEEDGYARDVTPRYARRFLSTVARIQGGILQQAWWDRAQQGIRRPYRLHRDDVEDAELNAAELLEGMPTTLAGFKDHPTYVLARHLGKLQTIHPPPPETRELGKFRGDPVYPRAAVVALKTADSWLRSEGRQVREGEQPLKLAKVRASTIGRMREVEAMREGLRVAGEQAKAAANGENGTGEPDANGNNTWEQEVMQGLYAQFQTDPYVPNPVVDGKIPKNNFGNIDMYVPSMLPAGAVHIPFKGTAKIARKLGFDYAEAVTGFEFKSRRAAPILDGIVIAAENEGAMLEAYWEAENDAAERARAKRRDRVLKRWTRLVHGLRIRKSLQEEYKDREPAAVPGEKGEDVEVMPGLAGGGFVTGADGVVQAYSLPKAFLPASSANSAGPSGVTSDNEWVPEAVTYDLETMDVDADPALEDNVQPDPPRKAPKTMKQLAEETAARLKIEFEKDAGVENEGEDEGEDDGDVTPPPVPSTSAPKAKKAPKAKPSRAPSERNQTKTKAKVGAPAARRASARKRRRDDGTDSDAEEEETEPSPAKRAKNDVAPLAPPPARSLRPRRSKTQTELQIEEERERAFQQAVAK
ncbi:hypothetical protein B0H17DRAFT_1157700 [Mycena rosella]|uniref:Rad4-domain-containing protein n=1 Tax=Mycena rosella TaxID=1033263 RepID=A0AAD7GPK7_MYCRO|nr:hypothetical protein B0H17DRAFT_1157700 [Mycena rosella]